MKREELIEALRRMAPETGSFCCLDCGHEHGCSVHGCAIIRAAVEEIERPTPPPNPPLTPDELREMDGDPVWIAAYGIDRYDIFTGFSTFSFDGIAQFYRAALPLSCYGDTWLAYRRKPQKTSA